MEKQIFEEMGKLHFLNTQLQAALQKAQAELKKAQGDLVKLQGLDNESKTEGAVSK